MAGTLYMVMYDLRGEPKRYAPLYSTLNLMGAKKVLESVWALRSTSDLRLIITSLKIHIDDDDGLVVCAVADWSSLGALTDINLVR